MKTNYNRPAIHRKFIGQGKMTEQESDRIIKEWEKEFINERVQDLGIGIIQHTAKWEDLHGYQNDEGGWEI